MLLSVASARPIRCMCRYEKAKRELYYSILQDSSSNDEVESPRLAHDGSITYCNTWPVVSHPQPGAFGRSESSFCFMAPLRRRWCARSEPLLTKARSITPQLLGEPAATDRGKGSLASCSQAPQDRSQGLFHGATQECSDSVGTHVRRRTPASVWTMVYGGAE